jgi:hypothetical protein
MLLFYHARLFCHARQSLNETWRWRPALSSSGNRARRHSATSQLFVFFLHGFAHTIKACGPPT